jgi:hypothetical protein
LFLKPYPYILGARDQGVYVNIGVNIAKTGSIIIQDPILKEMDYPTRSMFYKDFQFPGFFPSNENSGEIIPQFFYLYPVWIAIFYSIFGLELSLYITPIFGILATLGVFLLARTLFNDKIALIASLLLTLNFAQIWYAREPSTEILTQLLIFSGLATFILFDRNLSKYYGALSAFCFGEAFLTRITTVLLIPPIVLFFAYLRVKGELRKKHLYFIVPFSILSAHAIFTAFFISTWYTPYILNGILPFTLPPTDELLLASSLLFAAFIFLLDKFRNEISIRNVAKNQKFMPYLQFLAAFFIVIAFLYLYFMRPTEGVPDTYNLIKLSWYLNGLVGIILATIGLLLLLYKKPCREIYLFLGIALIYSAYFLINAQISLDHPFWIRRFLPVVIPSLLLCAAYSIYALTNLQIKKQPVGSILSSIILLILVVSSINSDSLIINHVEFKGVIGELEYLSNSTKDNSILLFGTDWTSFKLSTPMNYIFGKKSFIIQGENQSVFASQLNRWKDNYTIYAINLPDSLLKGMDQSGFIALPKGGRFLQTPLVGEGVNWAFPQNRTFNTLAYSIFELRDIKDISGDDYPIVIETCPGPNAVYLDGFYGCEYSDGHPFRWAKSKAFVKLITTINTSYILEVRINNSLKPSTVPNNNSLYINSCLLSQNLTQGDNSVTIPEECITSPFSTMLFISEEWVPSKLLGGGDERTLGTIIERIAIKTQNNQ